MFKRGKCGNENKHKIIPNAKPFLVNMYFGYTPAGSQTIVEPNAPSQVRACVVFYIYTFNFTV